MVMAVDREVESKHTVSFPIMSPRVAGDRAVCINSVVRLSVAATELLFFPFCAPYKQIRCQRNPLSFPVIVLFSELLCPVSLFSDVSR